MVVITENDVSQWDDKTGVLYHFPKRYQKYLIPGTEVIYYKGKIRDKAFTKNRLSDEPHYFGSAIIGQIYPDPSSSKGDLFATIDNFQQFQNPVLAKTPDGYIENIPETRRSNYWRDGVRPVDEIAFNNILASVEGREPSPLGRVSNLNDTEVSLESGFEGRQTQRYVTLYERDPKLRAAAIAIHGLTCVVCGFNFGEVYGDYGKGYIHIHHLTPVSEFGQATEVNPKTDLVPVCANCHSIIHRRKAQTLSIEEMQTMIAHSRRDSHE